MEEELVMISPPLISGISSSLVSTLTHRMKIQCAACEKACATLFCCADQAALCPDCDCRVHAANKLASKHQRLPLISPSPNDSVCCDICQEKPGYFFCLEDRALLCRTCDLSIHTSNTLTYNHKRFLVTGLRVALHAISTEDAAPMEANSPRQGGIQKDSPRQGLTEINSTTPPVNSTVQKLSNSSLSSPKARLVSPAGPLFPPIAQVSSLPSGPGVRVPSGSISMAANGATNSGKQNGMESMGSRDAVPDYSKEIAPGWRVDELLNLPDMATEYSFGDIGPSKADTPNLRDLDWTAELSFFDERALGESLGQVPQLPSTPTTSGLSRSSRLGGVPNGKNRLELTHYFCVDDDTLLVPNVGGQPSPKQSPTFPPLQKRRRSL